MSGNFNNAEIAQLVERNLAKVEVAGPSPVFRSRSLGEIRQSKVKSLMYQWYVGFFFVFWTVQIKATESRF